MPLNKETKPNQTKSISPKVNLIARPEFELVYYVVAVHHRGASNKIYTYGGVRGVMVTVVRNGHGDASLNPRRGCLHFT